MANQSSRCPLSAMACARPREKPPRATRVRLWFGVTPSRRRQRIEHLLRRAKGLCQRARIDVAAGRKRVVGRDDNIGPHTEALSQDEQAISRGRLAARGEAAATTRASPRSIDLLLSLEAGLGKRTGRRSAAASRDRISSRPPPTRWVRIAVAIGRASNSDPIFIGRAERICRGRAGVVRNKPPNGVHCAASIAPICIRADGRINGLRSSGDIGCCSAITSPVDVLNSGESSNDDVAGPRVPVHGRGERGRAAAAILKRDQRA